MLEQTGIVRLHVAQMREQHIRKGGAVGKAAKACKMLELIRSRWQNVRLLVGNHLQSVFRRAQEAVGRSKLLARLRIYPAAPLEGIQRRQRRLAAELGIASAGYELLRLDEELDL